MATTPLTINLDTDKVTAEVRAHIDKKLAELEAEVERLRADRDFARAEAKSIYDTCKQIERERDTALEVVRAAIAWRRRVAKAQRAGHRWTAGPQHWADGTDVALIAAVDALDTAGTAPAAGGEAER